MRKSWTIWALLACLLFLLTACSAKASKESKGLTIVTSFYPIYSLASEIAGPENEVLMLGSKAGIHDYEPSAAEVAAIYEADLFVYHSKNLESWAGKLDPNLQKSKVRVLEGASQLSLLPQKGLDNPDVMDPHSWLDPMLWAEEGQLLASELAKLDPDQADQYKKRADDLAKRAEKLVAQYEQEFSGLSNKQFVTQHTAFSYLAERFGLEQLGIAGISPEQEPNAKQLMEIEDFVKAKGIKTIYVESQASPKIASQISQASGAKLEVLDPLESDPDNGKSYLENLESNLEILLKNFKGEKE